jgi:hypothetical protein
MNKWFVVLVVMIAVWSLAACASPESYEKITSSAYLKEFGIDAEKEYIISPFEKIQGDIGAINASFSSYFFGGGGSVKGTMRPGTVLGFAIRADNGNVAALEFPRSKIDFMLREEQTHPTVRFEVKKIAISYEKKHTTKDEAERLLRNAEKFIVPGLRGLSTSEILEGQTTSLKITLSPETFSREVAPLFKN